MSIRRASESDGVGTRIRQARRHRGFTQKTLADKAAIHANTLSSIENDKSVPNRVTLQRIADALQYSLEELTGTGGALTTQPESVEALLADFRNRHPASFENWDAAMWERYLDVCTRMRVSNEDLANYFADKVTREFVYVRKLLELFDANREHNVTTLLGREHDSLIAERDESRVLGRRVETRREAMQVVRSAARV